MWKNSVHNAEWDLEGYLFDEWTYFWLGWVALGCEYPTMYSNGHNWPIR